MKVYPLIFSRTKREDFVPGFLVRPIECEHDTEHNCDFVFDYKKASRYVNIAIEKIKHTSGMRCVVFSAGDYAVYSGIACYTPLLIEKLAEKLDGTDYQAYQTDEADRPLVFFIGFAVKKSDYHGNVPNVDLLKTYQIYLEYLKHQFYEVNTDTEITEGIELEDIPCVSNFKPDCETADRISILKNYDAENYQNIMNYYFKQIMENPDKEISFVSDILPDDVKVSIPYSCFSLSEGSIESCIAKLKQQQLSQEASHIQQNQPIEHKTEIRFPDKQVLYPSSNDSIRSPDPNQIYSQQPQKKNNTPANSSLIILVIIIIIILLLIVLFKPSNSLLEMHIRKSDV